MMVLQKRSSMKHNNQSRALLGLLAIWLTASISIVIAYGPRHPPFVRRKDLIGIWKLTHTKLQFPTTASTSGSKDGKEVRDDEAIVLRLNEDGTFDPYTQTPQEGDPPIHQILGRGGTWEYQDKALILAANRPEDGDPMNVHDTVLSGKLNVQVSQALQATDQAISASGEADQETIWDSDETTGNKNEEDVDVQLSIPEGQVLIGKFMYPKKHKAFFDEPMLFHQSCVGSFGISQLLGNLNARLKEEREAPKPVAKFHKKDFHGRRFYLTASPHKINPGYAARDKHFDEDKVVHDIRVMPISFHANNTFSAEGTEKTLRGRYGIAGKERDRLWFQVNLFGAGRSAPGSVYSEGRLLSHDDRRGYLGNIQTILDKNNQTLFFVEGEMYFGTDIKTPKKPNSMGIFSMQEIATDVDDDYDDETDDDDDDDEDDSDDDDSNMFFEESEGAFQ